MASAGGLSRRRHFRRTNRRLIVAVRTIMFLAGPLLYLAFADVDDGPGPELLKNSEPDRGRLTRRLLIEPTAEVRNCTPAAIFDFPSDGLTREQRRSGWIAVHCLLACYSFVLLAIVCDEYFVPAIEKMCRKLEMAEDVAGATFMAAASSSPELFINSVGTFITEGDLGVGTIVGSAVFNILAVPACCGLLAGQVLQLDWWAVSRDSLMYGIAVIALIFTLEDEKIMWYEAAALVLAYALYITAMYFNEPMDKCVRRACQSKKKSAAYSEITPLVQKEGPKTSDDIEIDMTNNNEISRKSSNQDYEDIDTGSIWKWPDESVSFWGKTFWTLTWPIGFVLWLTIPDCKKHSRMYVVTFGMCIVWIGITSYFVAWMITAVGDTIRIPDSVMGITFLAAGTSVPEAVTSVIVTNQGHGSMGISNSIGSNTFDILLCLGLPWFIKSAFYPTHPGEHWVYMSTALLACGPVSTSNLHQVQINSSGLTYNAISLLSTLLGLYISFLCNKFKLDWKIGFMCTMIYAGFLTLASMIELNFFFPVNLPTCNN